MIKVLIMHNAGDPALPSGELGVAIAESEALQEKGIFVHLHVIRNEGLQKGCSAKTLHAGLSIIWSIDSFKLVNRLICDCQPDVVHFHGLLPLLTPSAFHACKQKKIPVIQTLHNFRWVCVEGGLYRRGGYCEKCIHGSGIPGVAFGCSRGSRIISFGLWVVNFVYRRSGLLFKWVDRFIAVSDFVRDKHIEAGFPPQKIQVKHNAAPDISEIVSSDVGSPKMGVTFVGRLAPAKGTSLIKEIVRSVDMPVNVIGDGPDYPELFSFCRERKLSHVKFWGQIPHENVLKIVSTSQCLIVPSVCGEAYPLAGVEALACGTPVIASDFAGPAEIVKKSRCGLLADPKNPTTFIDAIRRVADDPKAAHAMGLAGKAYTEQHLNKEVITNRLISIYREVIADYRKE